MKRVLGVLLFLLAISDVNGTSNFCNVDGGFLSGGTYEYCSGDGIPDLINPASFLLTGELGDSFAWILTDSHGNILWINSNIINLDLEGAPESVNYLYHIGYDDMTLQGFVVGNSLYDLSGCYSLSNSLMIRSTSGSAPVANYNFYSEGRDISDNTNDLVKKGTTHPISDYEECRRYMEFGETSSGYLIKDDPTYDLADNGAFTVMFWMRTPDMSSDQKIVGQADLPTDDYSGFVIGPEDRSIKAEVFAGSPSNTMTIRSSPLETDRWYHVALVYSSTSFEYKLYINGTLDKEFDDVVLAWSAPAEDQGLVVGIAPWDRSSFNYRGDLDDLSIYDTNLSARKIENIYLDNYVCPQGLAPLYVDAAATGRNTGLSWDDAFTDLQEAIDQSCKCLESPAIWVASGTYSPSKMYDIDRDGVLEEREKTFYITRPTKMYGGFRGTERSKNQRDDYFRTEAPTILTGVLDNSSDTAFHVVTISNASINNSYVLNRLTIQYGRATDLTSSSNNAGGGLYMSASGINSPEISNCTFINNAGVNGGAFYASGQGCHISLDNCLFNYNSALEDGGAIMASGQSTSVDLINNSLVNNSASNGGALYLSGQTIDASLINCIFWNNDASSSGYDIYSSKGGMNLKIANSITTQGGIFIADDMDIDTTMSFMHDDPMLDNDLTLMGGSPAVDAGDSTFVNAIFDLYGNPRMLGARVDMGAYESGRPCNQTLRFHLPQMLDNYKGALYTDKNIVFNATIMNFSDIEFSHFEGATFSENFQIDQGSKMVVIAIGCD